MVIDPRQTPVLEVVHRVEAFDHAVVVVTAITAERRSRAICRSIAITLVPRCVSSAAVGSYHRHLNRAGETPAGGTCGDHQQQARPGDRDGVEGQLLRLDGGFNALLVTAHH